MLFAHSFSETFWRFYDWSFARSVDENHSLRMKNNREFYMQFLQCIIVSEIAIKKWAKKNYRKSWGFFEIDTLAWCKIWFKFILNLPVMEWSWLFLGYKTSLWMNLNIQLVLQLVGSTSMSFRKATVTCVTENLQLAVNELKHVFLLLAKASFSFVRS